MSKLDINDYIEAAHNVRFLPGSWHINLGAQTATHNAGKLAQITDSDIDSALLVLSVWEGK